MVNLRPLAILPNAPLNLSSVGATDQANAEAQRMGRRGPAIQTRPGEDDKYRVTQAVPPTVLVANRRAVDRAMKTQEAVGDGDDFFQEPDGVLTDTPWTRRRTPCKC